MWEKRNLYPLLWRCKLVQPLWKTVWWFFKTLKILKNIVSGHEDTITKYTKNC
jgi:hypothetical protein